MKELACLSAGDRQGPEVPLRGPAGSPIEDLHLQVCSDGRQPCEVSQLEVDPEKVRQQLPALGAVNMRWHWKANTACCSCTKCTEQGLFLSMTRQAATLENMCVQPSKSPSPL